MPPEIWEHINTVEECYEFMLAYAARGHSSDEGSKPGGQICEFLQRAATAIANVAEECSAEVQEEGLEPVEKYRSFLAVLDRDARDSLAAIEMVLAQPSISSQLIDNLNAPIPLPPLPTHFFPLAQLPRSPLTPPQSRC